MAAARACVCCGDVFAPRKDASSYCTKLECRRERERVLKAEQRCAVVDDALLLRYRDEIAKARRRGDLTETDALELLISPSERVLAMLAEAA